MARSNSNSVSPIDKRIVRLGTARQQTKASYTEVAPEMVGDKTQRIGG